MASVSSEIMGMKTAVYSPQNQYGPEEDFDARQTAFQQGSESAILRATEHIQKTASSKERDFTSLFHDLMDQFGKERQIIAVKAGTKEPEQFGKPTGDLDDGSYLYTPLMGVYKQANKLALDQLSEQMSTMTHTHRKFIETTKKTQETVLNRGFSTQIDILSSADVQKWAQDVSPSIYRKFGEQAKKTHPDATPFELFGMFKRENPDAYKQGKMHFHLKELVTTFPSPKVDHTNGVLISGNPANLKSDYALVTMRTQIGNQMYATNQWLTWLYRSYNRDPFERMTDPEYRPVITVLHQDLYLKKGALDECSRLFSQIMNWDRKTSSVADLKNQVALLRYIFAQTMPYLRGSAAVGEWLEASIYNSLGFSCSYLPEYAKESVDLVAITSLKFSDYLRRYDELVKIADLEN